MSKSVEHCLDHDLTFQRRLYEGLNTTSERCRRWVVPQLRLTIITAKDSDNRVLECAVAGRADAIVTGDRKHLLTLGSYDGIPLLSPRAFLDRLDR